MKIAKNYKEVKLNNGSVLRYVKNKLNKNETIYKIENKYLNK